MSHERTLPETSIRSTLPTTIWDDPESFVWAWFHIEQEDDPARDFLVRKAAARDSPFRGRLPEITMKVERQVAGPAHMVHVRGYCKNPQMPRPETTGFMFLLCPRELPGLERPRYVRDLLTLLFTRPACVFFDVRPETTQKIDMKSRQYEVDGKRFIDLEGVEAAFMFFPVPQLMDMIRGQIVKTLKAALVQLETVEDYAPTYARSNRRSSEGGRTSQRGPSSDWAAVAEHLFHDDPDLLNARYWRRELLDKCREFRWADDPLERDPLRVVDRIDVDVDPKADSSGQWQGTLTIIWSDGSRGQPITAMGFLSAAKRIRARRKKTRTG